LGSDCFSRGTVLHEIGHFIGLFHEHARIDRDTYIRVNYNNLPSSSYLEYDKKDFINTYGLPYDLASDMHYGAIGFSINGQRSIDTVNPDYQKTIGQRLDLSFLDIKAANQAYCRSKYNRDY
jgi:astacin